MKGIKEQIAIMQAFADGKTIQVGVESETGWKWATEKNPKWNWELFDYRVLPEYEPYPDEKAFMSALKEHGAEVRGISSDGRVNIGLTYAHGNYMCLLSSRHYHNIINFSALFEHHVWLNDGTPCGVKIEHNSKTDCGGSVEVCGNDADAEDSGGPFYEAVDLGLPSGTKWANMNVGAYSPEDAGKYFAWGDREGFRAENINEGMFTRKWYNKRQCHLIKKDITPDSGYDAARTNMGAGWQMSSKEDLQELCDHTRHEFATINDVDGTKFINKTDESKYIFIPFAGRAVAGRISIVEYWSDIWTTAPESCDEDDAWRLNCNDRSDCYIGTNYRFYGFSVRGVIKS